MSAAGEGVGRSRGPEGPAPHESWRPTLSPFAAPGSHEEAETRASDGKRESAREADTQLLARTAGARRP